MDEKHSPAYATTLVSKENGVCRITLNRPRNLHSMSPVLMDDLNRAFCLIEKDEEIRTVVITGAGKAFSAGGEVSLDVSMVSRKKSFEWRQYDRNFCNRH